MPHLSLRILVCLVLLPGCRCSDAVMQVPPPALSLSSNNIDFGAVYVGQFARQPVEFRNAGGATTLALSPPEPFAVSHPSLTLGRGSAEVVEFTFAPTEPGPFETTIQLDSVSLVLRGDATPVPSCAPVVCASTRFDFTTRSCVNAPAPVGTACASACVSAGSCAFDGRCEGLARDCDDGNACTIDACDVSEGCTHPARACTSPDPCQVATCDPVLGCVLADAPDGTLCGPDDCLSTVSAICLSGRCEVRPRPDLSRCSRRWIATDLPAGAQTGAFDPLGGRVLTAVQSGTWEWDGSNWLQRFPFNALPFEARCMVWNDARQRVMATDGLSTWEWDRQNWLPVSTGPGPTTPIARCAWDSVRDRLVALVDELGSVSTWELGTTWAHAGAAPADLAGWVAPLAFNPLTGRVTAVGETSLWEWTGTSWSTVAGSTNSPFRNRYRESMAFDPVRRVFVVSAGTNELWEWNGVSWAQSAPPNKLRVLVWDGARQTLLAFGGVGAGTLLETTSQTWVRTGSAWVRLREQPQTEAAAWNSQRRTFMATSNARTLEWSGQWVDLAVPGPNLGSLAFDPASGKFLGVGANTWEWDSQTWSSRGTPPVGLSELFWNPLHQRFAASVGNSWVGGTEPEEVAWEWDGTTWVRFTNFTFGSATVYDPQASELFFVSGSYTFAWSPDAGLSQRSSQSAGWPDQVVLEGNRKLLVTRSSTGIRTLEWSGTGWVDLQIMGGPDLRSAWPVAIGFDDQRRSVLLVATDGTVWQLLR
jgi:hypothetical protein